MNPFRQILEDTASLLRDVRRGWNHVSWRLAWWSRRRRTSAGKERAERENVRRGIRATSKMCRECRALIPSGASECPECGVSTAHIRSGGVGRALAGLFPYEMTTSMALISAFFVLYVMAVLISATLPRGAGEAMSPLQAILHPDFRANLLLGANHYVLSAGPQPWRLLTAVFLHAHLIHLGFNAFALRVLGPFTEEVYGPRKMFVIFLLAGFLGNVVSLAWNVGIQGQRWVQVGASGGIFGFIGLAAAYGFRRKDMVGAALRRQMIQWTVIVTVLGLFMGADNAAHFGGLGTGALMGFLLPDPHRAGTPASERLWRVLARAGVLACAAVFAIALFYAVATLRSL